MTEEELAELRERIRQEELARLQEREAELAEERKRIRGELEAELREQFERRQELVRFAEEITSGEQGLSAKPEEVVAALEGLAPEVEERLKSLLRAKVVQFGELGSGREGQGGLKPVPQEFRRSLGRWVQAGQPLEEFFGVNPELGEAGLYDLREWQK